MTRFMRSDTLGKIEACKSPAELDELIAGYDQTVAWGVQQPFNEQERQAITRKAGEFAKGLRGVASRG